MTVTNPHNRIIPLDLLRGIAVILMVEQHTGYWFWKSGGSIGALIAQYPLMVTVNGLGGLAAPLFIALAGAGTSLSFAAGKTGRQIFLRGILIMLSGYMVNILTPAWFAPWSWFVLHLIGSGMCISPLLRRMNSAALLITALVIIATTVALLSHSGMPRYFSNSFMRGTYSAAGALRLAVFGGNFPVFPWMALFIAGMVCGRWICTGRYNYILKTSGVLLSAAIILFITKQWHFQVFNNDWGRRLMTVNLYMFPAYPIQLMTLSAVTLLLMFVFLFTGRRLDIKPGNILVLLGRVSLSIFILHIVIIRNFMVWSGLWQSFSEPVTALLQLVVIAFIMLLVYLWSRKDFRYGFEWLLRRVR